ncbi:hypothetical protein Pth03_02750 [Planotetraspora thailandica]|uniref:Uncharacterized protein n=1 Tax=Planotetraspora thailandica TaxID=487172 RepID=A0A8J3UYN5_9ACTN|nr:DUF5947 family protein [Planotetraspora thailandica]GII51886.1 hypothetical protein Pth03_02750 [Planotetraspora thailandica]
MTAKGLRRFRQPPGQPGAAPASVSTPADARCELCAGPAGEDHPHVVDVETRALLCACRGCHLLFDPAAQGRYRAVPRRHLHAARFRMTAADWEDLQIPVRTAFFFHNSTLGRTVVFYPSPAGATQSLLPLPAWERVLAANPELPPAEPDVEALLVDRGADGFTCHLVPISTCYELVGLVRRHWKGFSGGQEAWAAIDGFFADLARRGTPTPTGQGGAPA